MEQQFATLGLVGERISAVTPAALDVALSDAPSAREIGAALADTEMCVTASHRAAWRAIAARDVACGLVLEDDAVLSPKLPAFLSAVPEAIEALDLVRIETGVRRVRLAPASRRIGDVSLHQAFSDQWGTAGYVISAACARRLLTEPRVFALPLDHCMFDPRGPIFAAMNWRQCAPGLCIQGDQREAVAALWRSDVTTQRRAHRADKAQRRDIGQKIGRESARLYQQGARSLRELHERVTQGVRPSRIPFAE